MNLWENNKILQKSYCFINGQVENLETSEISETIFRDF